MGLWQNAIDLMAGKRRARIIPERESMAYPKLRALVGSNRAIGTAKPTPANLRYFSRTVYARRAINRIRGAIEMLGWEVVSADKKADADIDHIAACLRKPNHSDTFSSLIGQVIEDMLVTGAGVIERAASSDPIRPAWLWPVDATTIRPTIAWDGTPDGIRFLQGEGYTGGSIMSDLSAIKLAAREIIYIRMNGSTESPYGYGALEIAYESISRQLGVGSYASNLAGNAQPQNLLYSGDMTQEQLDSFRAYWRNEVEGQGQMPMLAGQMKPDIIKLHSATDDALYLKWQEFLKREIAVAFGLSPQNLGVESDVNRSTAEVAEDRDWDTTIAPIARMVQQAITNDLLHQTLSRPDLRFRFTGLDREDESQTAQIYQTYYQNNLMTPNEQRQQLGLPPLKSTWADLTYGDLQMAIAAAKSKPAPVSPVPNSPTPED